MLSRLIGLKGHDRQEFAGFVQDRIESAHELAQAGRMNEALAAFLDLRRGLTTRAPKATLNARVAGVHGALDREMASFRQGIAARNASATAAITIFSDSLGLPATEDKTKTDAAFEKTYAYALTNLTLPDGRKVNVRPWCRRYGTIETVHQLLASDPKALGDCRDAHVLVHVGLNETVVRIFLEEQRLALGLLDDGLSARVVEFARLYRSDIIRADWNHTYVPPDRHLALLKKTAALIRTAGPASVTFATIILPPMSFWSRTPAVSWIYGRYNAAIMESAVSEGYSIFEIDRIMWSHGLSRNLRKDGMHLALPGIELFAQKYLALLADGTRTTG